MLIMSPYLFQPRCDRYFYPATTSILTSVLCILSNALIGACSWLSKSFDIGFFFLIDLLPRNSALALNYRAAPERLRSNLDFAQFWPIFTTLLLTHFQILSKKILFSLEWTRIVRLGLSNFQ